MNSIIADRYRRKRVLVLGASGFIGRSVVRALRLTDTELLLADRRPFTNPDSAGRSKVSQIAVDLIPAGAVTSLIRELQPDIVINLAGYGVDRSQRDPDLAKRINVDLPAEAAIAANQLTSDWPGLRFVHVGSALEYGVASGNLDENSECAPTRRFIDEDPDFPPRIFHR